MLPMLWNLTILAAKKASTSTHLSLTRFNHHHPALPAIITAKRRNITNTTKEAEAGVGTGGKKGKEAEKEKRSIATTKMTGELKQFIFKLLVTHHFTFRKKRRSRSRSRSRSSDRDRRSNRRTRSQERREKKAGNSHFKMIYYST